ncbi:MAG: hypothetical protein K8E66_00100, partial [Phycisphaerales bacterium]|nr:hypothetical protein [Phycisphaerales bacterium]
MMNLLGMTTLAQGSESGGGLGLGPMLLIGGGVLLFVVFFALVFFASRYKRCPPNRILVIWKQGAKGSSLKCVHTGGQLIWPVVQDYSYMTLAPIVIEIPLEG